ncbi:MAG TPA: Hsp20/alpha crystallin family protein [Candidatus Babeliales bacterium]|nr:Hsp20/alpha crystallin family protein [Candidatus Babeliales bacterium]
MFKKTLMISCLLSSGISNARYHNIDFVDLFLRFPEDLEMLGGISTNRINISEKDDILSIDIELPGYEKEEVRVNLHNNGRILEIEAKREEKKEEKETQQSTNRQFNFRKSLPYPVQVGSEKATLKNGILSLAFKKAEQPAHTITID